MGRPTSALSARCVTAGPRSAARAPAGSGCTRLPRRLGLASYLAGEVVPESNQLGDGCWATRHLGKIAALGRERERVDGDPLIPWQRAHVVAPSRPPEVLVEHRESIGERPGDERPVAHRHRDPSQLVGGEIANFAWLT